MKRGNTVFICLCGCNAELPDRFKGRQKIFLDADHRKKWHIMNPGKKALAPLTRKYR